MALDHTLIATYLNDHRAGSVSGIGLARRTRNENKGTPLAAVLDEIAADIEEDQEMLDRIMERLDVSHDHKKLVAAWALEKAGRLKPNGRLLGYFPLSRVVELEGLVLGVTGKLLLWRALHAIQPDEPRLGEFDFHELISRAERQRETLERERIAAARRAFLPA